MTLQVATTQQTPTGSIEANAGPWAQLPQEVATQLMEEVNSVAGAANTSFAQSMLDLLEVTARISQLDQLVADASAEGDAETTETRKWKEISTMSAKFARSSLLDRQLAAIDRLIDIGAKGGSLTKEVAEGGALVDGVQVAPFQMPFKVSAGTGAPESAESASEGEDAGRGATASPGAAVPPPPGLPAPPGLEQFGPRAQATAPTPAPAPTASGHPARQPPGLSRGKPAPGLAAAPGLQGAQAKVAKPGKDTRKENKGAKDKGQAQQSQGESDGEPGKRAPVFASTCLALNFEDYDDE